MYLVPLSPMVPLPTYDVLPPVDDVVLVTVMLRVLLTVLPLPTASVNFSASTEMVAIPPLDREPVKVAV